MCDYWFYCRIISLSTWVHELLLTNQDIIGSLYGRIRQPVPLKNWATAFSFADNGQSAGLSFFTLDHQCYEEKNVFQCVPTMRGFSQICDE